MQCVSFSLRREVPAVWIVPAKVTLKHCVEVAH